MALSADKPREYGHGDFNEYPVQAAEKIYQGSAVGIVAADGYADVLAAGMVFVGFAEKTADNTGGAAGAIRVRCRREGQVKLVVVGVDATKVGEPVFATDDDTFTLTSAANRPQIGIVSQHVSGTTCWVMYTIKDHVAP